VKVLTDSLVALLPVELRVYKGTVPAKPVFPYVLVVVSVPDVLERAQSRQNVLHGARARCTVVGLTMDSVMIVAPKVAAAMDGALVDPVGWSTGRVESRPNDQWVREDLGVTDTATGSHPLYTVLDFLVTASRNPS
jgi:hypothetical protein